MPTVDHVGISRRISSDKERRRLRDIVEQMRPPGSGFIVRTVAEGVPEKDLRADMAFLIKLWNEVVAKTETARCPSLIYNDLDLLLRTVRDLFTADVEKLIIDSRRSTTASRSSSRRSCPTSTGRSSCTTAAEPIFDGYGIEIEIDRALERKVWLKSGGYLIIDEMEALTAIDVNTGRFVGKKSLEDTITKTNLEAAREVADQLRIRSIGGMIVVDFIDMDRVAEPRQGHAGLQRVPEEGPQQGHRHPHLRAGPGRDDAQAHARIAAAPPDRAVSALRGQGLHQVAPDDRLRDCFASCAGRAA